MLPFPKLSSSDLAGFAGDFAPDGAASNTEAGSGSRFHDVLQHSTSRVADRAASGAGTILPAGGNSLPAESLKLLTPEQLLPPAWSRGQTIEPSVTLSGAPTWSGAFETIDSPLDIPFGGDVLPPYPVSADTVVTALASGELPENPIEQEFLSLVATAPRLAVDRAVTQPAVDRPLPTLTVIPPEWSAIRDAVRNKVDDGVLNPLQGERLLAVGQGLWHDGFVATGRPAESGGIFKQKPYQQNGHQA